MITEQLLPRDRPQLADREDTYEAPTVLVLGALEELTGSLQPNYGGGELGPRPHRAL